MERGEFQRRSNLHGLYAGLERGWNQPSIPWFSDEDEDFESAVEDDSDFDAFTGSQHHHSLPSPSPDLHHRSITDRRLSWHRGDSQPGRANTRAHTKRSHPTCHANRGAHSKGRRSSHLSVEGLPSSLGPAQSPSPSSPVPWSSSFVDLTNESSTMASSKRKARANNKPALRGSDEARQPMKRRKVQPKAESLEEVDLRDVDSESDLTKVLERQRAATIKDQQDGADQPSKLGKVTCVVCMEELTNITATHCGHLFCHTCLMEALIAGENQGGEPGKGQSKCPICRKKVKRPKDSNDKSNVIPLEIKLSTKSRPQKGKGRA